MEFGAASHTNKKHSHTHKVHSVLVKLTQMRLNFRPVTVK